MRAALRELAEQVVVVTGASSGIGRETALELARRGASVVLAARGEVALEQAAEDVERMGGRALAVVADVAEWGQVERLARKAVERFGRIDTWVNNAAVSAYAAFEQLTIAEIDRILRVDLLGSIYGAKAALAYMKQQARGTIITVGSGLGEQPLPLLSMYCTAKAGLRAFTESLRLELRHDHPGITVTLILPSSIDTPFYAHARSKRGVRPKPYPPVYAPSSVAHAIVFAAQHRRRQIYVGAAGQVLTWAKRISSTVVDWYLLHDERAVRNMLSDTPDDGRSNLFTSTTEISTSTLHGESRGSFYTELIELHRHAVIAAVAIAGIGGLLARRYRAR
jgi:short-subunit dehydrogenase